jgi:methionine-gamma-lyase
VHAAPIDLSSMNPFPASTQGVLSYEAMAIGGHPVAEGGAV